MKKSLSILFTLLMLTIPAYAIAAANRVFLPIIMYSEAPVPTAPPTSTPTSTPTITPSPTATLTPTFTPTPDRTGCDTHYPTICVPPPPPDINCSDSFMITHGYHDFTVLQPDPHNFDRNHDGIGCESTEL